ncbi:MAG: sensor histidine kinase [Clostridia bacterium]|nr:sensor histidine kinase [Clostridia bacterium]
MKFFHADITFRWFRSVFSFVLFFLVAVELVILFFVNDSLYSNVETYLDRRNETNTKTFASLIVENQNDIYNAANSFMNSMSDLENIRFEIYDLSGRNFLSSDGFTSLSVFNISDANGKKTVTNDPVTGERLMIMNVPLRNSGGSVCGAIRYIVSLENVFRLQVIYTVASVVAIILVAFLVFLSGQYFVQSIVKPVNTIIRSAQLIAKGDFSIRTQKKYDDEIGKLSDAINNMAQELSKIDTLKNEFISSVSHELRTPLTAIRGWNETISMCDPETEGYIIKKGLSVIDAETDRLGRMIEELLDYSKIQSGRFTISKSKVNLFTLVRETLDIYSQKATSAGIEIKYDTPAFEPVITGDPNRLKQVFINVLDNAVKHSPKDSTVEIHMLRTATTYSVIFKDHGSGIKKEELPFIKGRFYKGSSTKPGSGLGLSICDEIVNLHGGTLDIDSEQGEGTTVAITLPISNN